MKYTIELEINGNEYTTSFDIETIDQESDIQIIQSNHEMTIFIDSKIKISANYVSYVCDQNGKYYYKSRSFLENEKRIKKMEEII